MLTTARRGPARREDRGMPGEEGREEGRREGRTCAFAKDEEEEEKRKVRRGPTGARIEVERRRRGGT